MVYKESVTITFLLPNEYEEEQTFRQENDLSEWEATYTTTATTYSKEITLVTEKV